MMRIAEMKTTRTAYSGGVGFLVGIIGNHNIMCDLS
jgi:hypothetical protein